MMIILVMAAFMRIDDGAGNGLFIGCSEWQWRIRRIDANAGGRT